MVEVCQCVDAELNRCTKIAQKKAVLYFGDHTLYGQEEIGCIKVYFCPTHMKNLRGRE